MTATVTPHRHGAAALLELSNPPVNAASQALRAALLEAVAAAEADPEVKVIVLYGAGRGFIAGADIREFGQPPEDPWLPEVCDRLEACRTPILSVLHGVALGGGLEVALATHGRVALPGLTVGFPEVTLGILPGAGGTQRTPRLTGMAAALDLIVSGRRIGAEEALSLGLVDAIGQGTPEEAARALAEDVLAGRVKPKPTSTRKAVPDMATLAKARSDAADSNLFAPGRCVEAVAASVLPLEPGLRRERALFDQCMASPQRAALIHAFFAEREVAKIPEAGFAPRPFARVGVVGAGTMGRGIAASLLITGLEVTLVDQNAAALDDAAAWIGKALKGAVARGKMPAETAAAPPLELHLSLDRLADADLVIEAVIEDLTTKQAVFAALDAVCKPGTLLATNTSYLDVNALAGATTRPSDVLGLHFFAPAHVMRLIEVVASDTTSPAAVATGFALAKRLRKVAVRAGVCDGFIGNRILARTRRAAEAMVLAGADPGEIDAALEATGFAMGPFAAADLSGLDIGQAGRRQRGETAAVADALCARGWYGQKTGRGFYDYADRARKPNPDLPAVLGNLRTAPPRTFGAEEIVDNYLSAMADEGAAIVSEGIALRPVDVDAVLLFGYGFPRHLGGPMHWAAARETMSVDR